jgi:hypothetical protein
MDLDRESLPSPARSRFLLALLVLLPLLATGCGAGKGVGRVVPVSGKVTLNGVPLTAGNVSFVPDATKGNTSKFSANGLIKEDGSYELTTDTKKGAPPGHYKIAVMTTFPGAQGHPVQINPKYNNASTSKLEIEVTESPGPGAYDLAVTR